MSDGTIVALITGLCSLAGIFAANIFQKDARQKNEENMRNAAVRKERNIKEAAEREKNNTLDKVLLDLLDAIIEFASEPTKRHLIDTRKKANDSIENFQSVERKFYERIDELDRQ